MDIFHNSVLCSLEDKMSQCSHDNYIPGVQSEFTHNDMRVWMEKISSGSLTAQPQSTKLQEQIFDTLHRYASGTLTCDKLLNVTNLEKLGFNAQIINLLYKHICGSQDKNSNNDINSKFQSIFMSIFLNTHGVCKVVDLVNALCMSIDLRKGKKSVTHSSERSENETTDEKECRTIHDIIKRCQRNHHNNLAVKNIIASQIDEIKAQLEEAIFCKLPQDETLLSVVSHAMGEPKYATAKFEEAVQHFDIYTECSTHKFELNMMMKSQNVNLDSILSTLKKELHTLVLPYCWTLMDMDSTIVLDILLNVMLGCKSEIIRAFTETVEFAFITHIYLSDTVLNNISIMMKYNNLDDKKEAELVTTMVKVWKRASAFVAFLGLFRQIFPQNNDITVGRVDHFNIYEMFDSKTQKRNIAENCIYFHKGFFHITFKTEHCKMLNIKTKSFYELFYQVLHKRQVKMSNG